ncbi:MAG: phage terminase small subunit P27 family [Ruminococcus sp.]|nr:phage terminase small subunit P27 family [Ruminococcus sp.]
MGRPRKQLSQQKGNLTSGFQQQREFEEQLIKTGTGDLLKPPAWVVDSLAKREWRRIVPEMTSNLDLIGNLDVANLGGYCNAFAAYVKATKLLKKQPMTVMTAAGPKENPLIGVQKKYAEEMRAFASKCGLTIDSRLKFAAEKAKNVDDSIEEAFGDI